MAKRKTTEERNKELAKDGFKLRHYGLKLRMEPNEAQKKVIYQTIGNARFTFNFYLSSADQLPNHPYDRCS
jgi:putative transposase